jgi:C4-dicarboxylate transporter DctM subunit
MVGLILLGVMLVLTALNIPIAFAMGLGSLAGLLYHGDLPIGLIAQRMVVMVDSFPLLAIPLFMLAGEIMSVGACSTKLVDLAMSIVGNVRGGLAHVTVVSSMFFSGVSGSGSADTAAIGSIMIPAMIKKGYDPDFATAIQATAGTIGPVIPPSIPMVVLGYVAGISVGDLFLGGVIPGILIGFLLMTTVYVYTRRRGDAYRGDVTPSMSRFFSTAWRALPALGLPVVILGGIFLGVFTATEAAVVAVFYGLAVELLIYKELKVKDLPGILKRAAMVSSMVMFIIAVSGIFGWLLAVAEFPQTATAFLLSLSSERAVTLSLINVLLLIAGCLLDVTAIIIIVMPVLMPVVTSLGLDPVHFGVMVIVNLGIGMITPPVGMALYVACGLSKRSISTVIPPLLPILLALVIALMLITYVPIVVTLLPNLLKVK